MFDPPEELHTRFEQALAEVKATLGREHGMFIGGKERFTAEKFEDHSPADTDVVLGIFQKGGEQEAQDALAAARAAFPGWRRTPWQERVRLLRRAADLVSERIFTISAALAMEVGKNRMESLGDVAETADLIRYYCDEMERNQGYIVEMGRDPLVGTAPQIIPSCSLSGMAGDQPVQLPRPRSPAGQWGRHWWQAIRW
jgi:1-pyrroline-5-carboxylate dehydrogenase